MLFQVLYRDKRSRNEIGVICHDSHILKGTNIIFDAAGGIVGNEDKLPAAVFDVFQKFPGTADQSLSDADGTIYIQKKEFLIFSACSTCPRMKAAVSG